MVFNDDGKFVEGEIIWAKAGSHVFWPAKVIENDQNVMKWKRKTVIACVEFLGTDVQEREAITDPSRIRRFDCERREYFIKRGQSSKNIESRLQFDKALVQAATLRQGVLSETASQSPPRDNPEKSDESMAVGTLCLSPQPNNVPCLSGTVNSVKSLGKNGCGADAKSAPRPARKVTKSSRVRKKCQTDCTSDRNGLRRGKKNKLKAEHKSFTQKDTKTSQPLTETQSENSQLSQDWPPLLSESKDDSLLFLCSSLDKTVQDNNGDEMFTSNNEFDEDTDEDDDDLPEITLTPHKESPGCEFKQGEVVWVKYRHHPHWPAQVVRIIKVKKKTQMYIKFFPWTSQTGRCLRVSPVNVHSFACLSEKREKFMKTAEKYYTHKEDRRLFHEAVQEAEGVLRRRALGKSETIVDNGEDLDELCMDADDEVFEEDGCQEMTQNNELSMAELDDEQEEPRRSSRKRRHFSKYNEILTNVKASKRILLDVKAGKIQSERHRIFHGTSTKEKNSLKRRSGFGPVNNKKVQEEMIDVLSAWYKETISEDTMVSTSYVFDVWLPEAIIYAIKDMENISYAAAEKIYDKGCEEPLLLQTFHEKNKKSKTT